MYLDRYLEIQTLQVNSEEYLNNYKILKEKQNDKFRRKLIILLLIFNTVSWFDFSRQLQLGKQEYLYIFYNNNPQN